MNLTTHSYKLHGQIMLANRSNSPRKLKIRLTFLSELQKQQAHHLSSSFQLT